MASQREALDSKDVFSKELKKSKMDPSKIEFWTAHGVAIEQNDKHCPKNQVGVDNMRYASGYRLQSSETAFDPSSATLDAEDALTSLKSREARVQSTMLCVSANRVAGH
jgi:hypothetical protein